MQTNQPDPYYTLVVMTYQRPEPLRECLNSLARQDIGSGKFEVLVIDDGSENDNLSIIETFKDKLSVRYLKQDHRGISAARNTGWTEAKGNRIGFIADDYRLPPNYVSTIDHFFNKIPKAQVITCNIRCSGPGFAKYILQLYKEMALLRKIEIPYSGEDVIASFRLPASRAAVFKKEILVQTGGFNERLTGGEDADLAMRLSKSGVPVYFLPKFYIEHWENKSFFLFLNQRFRYGWYSFDLACGETPQNARQERFLFFRLFYGRLPKDISNHFFGLARTSKKFGKFFLFIIFSPLILLNLFFYVLGYCCNAWKSRSK